MKGKVQTSKDMCSGASILTSGCQGGSSISGKSGTVNKMVRVSVRKGFPGKEWPVLGRSDEVPVAHPQDGHSTRSEEGIEAEEPRVQGLMHFFILIFWCVGSLIHF